MKINESSNNTTRTLVTRRLWRRLEEPRKIKLWYWLLPLLWLLLLLFGWFKIAPAMQNQIEENVSSTLLNVADAKDRYVISEVKADGQNVLVKAIASLDQKDFIKNTVSETTCDSWLAKQLKCPINVRVELEKPAEVVKAPIVEKPPEVVEPTKVSHDFSFVKSTEGISLNGEIATSDVKNQVINEAKRFYTISNDNLTITNLPQKFDDDWAYSSAWSLLKPLNEGHIEWTNGLLSITGEVDEENESVIRDFFNDSTFSNRLAALDLTVITVIDKCNERFVDVLSVSKIKFDTGSARISSESDSLLSELAALAQECNTKLSIEGHTDNVGSAQINERLSLARATSVVTSLIEKGVAPELLQAKGMGENVPIADNESELGRQENRRIEIKAIN